MPARLGNSGAPRWYDTDLGRLREYIERLKECDATAAEIVLHDGPADDYTGRVHVLRPDWEEVVRSYREAGISVYFHGSLTPAFATARWFDHRDELLQRYDPLLRFVAEFADDQDGSTFVVHGSGDPGQNLAENERNTSEFVGHIAERLARYSDQARVAVELRAGKDTRPTAAATTRHSVIRIIDQLDDALTGICWDVAHDFQNFVMSGSEWTLPDPAFLSRVTHMHVHDIGDDGEAHCPPTIGRVPIAEAITACNEVPVIMEIRWRMAERMGDPWDVLAESYRGVRARVTEAERRSVSTRS